MWDSRKYDTIRGKQAVLFINLLGKGLTQKINGVGGSIWWAPDHPYPPPPQTFNGHVNHLGDGGRNGFDTLVNVIHKKTGWIFAYEVSLKSKC